jgi:hypothetical protein
MKNSELREREMNCRSLRALERYKKVLQKNIFAVFFAKMTKSAILGMFFHKKLVFYIGANG